MKVHQPSFYDCPGGSSSSKLNPQNSKDSAVTAGLQMHFYVSCPYLKFGHFTANKAILQAFAGFSRVHVIDVGLRQGIQWPELLIALATRNGRRPSFRLTGIGPPQLDITDSLQQVGYKLGQFTESLGIEFEFRGFVANSPADIDAFMLNIRPREEEAVAVNSVFELHRLLARPGGIEKVLQSIKLIKTVIITIVEEESNHNCPVFMDRFNNALHYYSTMFDSLEMTAHYMLDLHCYNLLQREQYAERSPRIGGAILAVATADLCLFIGKNLYYYYC